MCLGLVDGKWSDPAFSRLTGLRRLAKLRIRFASKKKAMLRTDTSGTVAYPFFVFAIHVLRMDFCENIADSPAMIRLYARHLQARLEFIAGVFNGRGWELRTRAGLLILEVVNTGGLQFIPMHERVEWCRDD